MGSKAFESPLISHARMRAMYRALVETRVLSERAHRSAKLPKGLEACWVATAIDLKPGDLTSTGGATSLIRHTLQIGTREAARAATASEIKKTLRDLVTEKPSAKFPGTPAERLLCAAGQAMALQSLGNKGVVVAYVQQSELKPAALKRVLALCTGDVPLLIVATPSPKSPRISLEKAAKPAAIPVIPVDAGDVVALYRVAEESIHRARSGGGAVVIECVALGVDPIKSMRSQLIKKGICTDTWAANVDAGFRRMVGSL